MATLKEKEWTNKATVPVLRVLYHTTNQNIPIQGKTIIIAIGRRRGDPISEMTVYSTLNELEERDFIYEVEGRYLLTEKGMDVAEEYID